MSAPPGDPMRRRNLEDVTVDTIYLFKRTGERYRVKNVWPGIQPVALLECESDDSDRKTVSFSVLADKYWKVA